MSRLGKVPISVPSGVSLKVVDDVLQAKGPKGELSERLVGNVSLEVGIDSVLVNRADDSRGSRANQGLMRRLAANLVDGVSTGFSKTLEITGVGYRAEVKGSNVHLSLGFSHPIVYQLPDSVTATVNNQTSITLSGPSSQLVGEVAANIRKLRPPEPYKGKGIRYSDEQIRRKAGKAGAAK